jgi:protein SCO1/2
VSIRKLYCLTACLFVCLADAAVGQGLDPALQRAFDGAGVEEHLGAYIPDGIELLDHTGNRVTTGEVFASGRPVVLSFVYYDCPMLCSVVLDSFTKTMSQMDWSAGSEFDVITVSISPADTPETAAAARSRYGEALGKADAMSGWHFLTGTPEDVRALADAAGFQYKWIEDLQEFVHPAVLTFVAPDRKITRYLYGIDYPVRKVKNALGEASDGQVGTTLDRLILFCFQYDPVENAYVLRATNLMKLGGLLTVAALLVLFGVLRRRERDQRHVNPAYS